MWLGTLVRARVLASCCTADVADVAVGQRHASSRIVRGYRRVPPFTS
jgi:hypothetical protein